MARPNSSTIASETRSRRRMDRRPSRSTSASLASGPSGPLRAARPWRPRRSRWGSTTRASPASPRPRTPRSFTYTMQAFDDPPDVIVGGPGLTGARAIARTNPFAGDYAWGKYEVHRIQERAGRAAAGRPLLPGRVRGGPEIPMVVYMSKRLSDGVHRWSSPSDREPYDPAVFASLGYMVLQPDIVFRPRDLGSRWRTASAPRSRRSSRWAASTPPVSGSSGTRGAATTLLSRDAREHLAAGVAGAPITNVVSNYGNHHWSAGIAETDHIETAGGRWRFRSGKTCRPTSATLRCSASTR